jgi:type IV secretory pathway TrbF-like protein
MAATLTDEIHNPYVGNARRFNDVMAIPLRTIAMQRVLIWGLFAVIVIALVAVLVLSIRLASQPIYAFGFDRVRVRDGKSGAIVTESAVPINVQPMGVSDDNLREAAVAYWLPNFIETLFTVSNNIDDDKRNLIRGVRPFVAVESPAAKTVDEYLSTYNPVERGENQIVTVVADPIPPPRAPNVYHVTWTAQTKDLAFHVLSTQQQGATVTVAWGKPSPVFEKTDGGVIVGGNPAGMYITEIVSDRPIDPRATSAGVPTQQ